MKITKEAIIEAAHRASDAQLREAAKVIDGGSLSDADYEELTREELIGTVETDMANLDGLGQEYAGWIMEALTEEPNNDR